MHPRQITRPLILATLALSVACGWGSPEGYYQKSARLSCRYLKKCEKSTWSELGYNTIGGCVDDSTSKTEKKQFADLCSDFDKESARKCLRGGRKAIRKCDLEAPSSEDSNACATVCGNPLEGGTDLEERYANGDFLDPFNEHILSTVPEDEWGLGRSKGADALSEDDEDLEDVEDLDDDFYEF